MDGKADITYTYLYDHLHRLISEFSSGTGAVSGTEVEVIEFTYAEDASNPIHAPVSIQVNEGATTRYNYTATGNRLNKIEGIQTTTYESNDDNMIEKITIGGVVTQFYYDADSRRVKKTQGMDTTRYYGDTLEIINNTPTLYVFAGNLRVAQTTDTATTFYHKDHLGSTNAISQADGTIIDAGGYMPYGGDRSSNGLLQLSSYKFTDQEQDAGTGLYHYDARLN